MAGGQDRARCAVEIVEQRSERLRKQRERDRATAQTDSGRQATLRQKSTSECEGRHMGPTRRG